MSEKPTFHGRKTLIGWLDSPLKKIQRKRGFAESRLITDWPQIVGAAFAPHCAPQKLSFPKGQLGATLHVICEPAWAMELQFQEPVLLDKIATFFGYRAVGAIRIHQAPLPSKPEKNQSLVTLSSDDAPETLRQNVSLIEDTELRDALLRLGLSLEARRNSDT